MPPSARTAAQVGRGASGASSPTGETALTGSPPARRLYREIAADPHAELLLEVVGVGGSGKSVLLGALERLWTESGVPVGQDSTVLLDDAHLLPPEELHRLADGVRAGSVERLVLARRPYPRGAGLAELGGLLAQRRAPMVLVDLDRSGVAGRAALALGDRPSAALVDAVLAQTAGLPALVTRMLDALAAAGALESVRPGDPPPAGLPEQLGYQLERLPSAMRSLILALAVGTPLDAEVLGPVLELTGVEVSELVEQAAAAGLVDLSAQRPTLRLLYRLAVLAGTPPVRLLAQRRRLGEVQLERGSSVLTCAIDLLDSDATGAKVAAVFRAAADEVLRDGARHGFRPGLAGRLLDAAVRAGAPALDLAARRAEAAARDGDLDRALELADQVLAEPDAVSCEDRERAVKVAAVALARRGLLARSAELYRWLGAASMGANAVVAVPALLGTGALAEARELLETAAAGAPGVPGALGGPGAPGAEGVLGALGGPGASGAEGVPGALGGPGAPGVPAAAPRPPRPPTLLAGAESLLARGVYDTIAGSPTAALSQLARAAALLEPRASTVLLPDTPAALAALVAAHCGELEVAASVLERAVATGLGGVGAAARHRLLQGWVLMSRGATMGARALLADVDAAAAGRGLEPRDELVAAALEVGLARRAGDLGALMPAWGRAREAIVRHPVDLYVLQPLGELIVAAARLREQSWVRPHVDEAHALLARLGEPVLWSASVHWAELHAALIAEQWDEAAGHAAALERGASSGRYVEALAVAAQHWLAVLRDGAIDAEAVDAAARGLHAVGLSWEGGKLAGQAAIRSTDRKAMSALLQCARGLQSTGHNVEPSGAAPSPAQPSSSPPARSEPDRSHGRPQMPSSGSPLAAARPGGSSGAPAAPGGAPAVPAAPVRSAGGPSAGGALSDRELEVAKLVLAGMTYKEIGERLFISAKTVEHHVARMRQRLGSTSRGELMAHLRMIVNP